MCVSNIVNIFFQDITGKFAPPYEHLKHWVLLQWRYIMYLELKTSDGKDEMRE